MVVLGFGEAIAQPSIESPNPNPDYLRYAVPKAGLRQRERIYNPQTQIERTYLDMMGGFDYLRYAVPKAGLRQRERDTIK